MTMMEKQLNHHMKNHNLPKFGTKKVQEVGFPILADHHNVHMTFVAFFKSFTEMDLTSKDYSVLHLIEYYYWYSQMLFISFIYFDTFTVSRSH